jgi:NAD(P)-dependent dehydrogenase (short-subunit alcohol dehydrogenase family)
LPPLVERDLVERAHLERRIEAGVVDEDVVGAVVYFCGPGSDFVTGQTIVIDGGQTFH